MSSNNIGSLLVVHLEALLQTAFLPVYLEAGSLVARVVCSEPHRASFVLGKFHVG